MITKRTRHAEVLLDQQHRRLRRLQFAQRADEVLHDRRREAFARLVAVLNRHSDVAAALMAKAPQKGVLVTADPLQIPDIEIKPLEGAETETSKGASEKQ